MNIYQKLLEDIERTLPTLEGWCTIEKAKTIASLVMALDAKLYVEIGIFGGKSLIPAAMAMKYKRSGYAHGIDPWKKEFCLEGTNQKENNEWWLKVDLEKIYEGFVRSVKNLELEKFCFWRRDQSESSCYLYSEEVIDILHIDGNHSSEKSMQDVSIWFPKVKKGGFIIFDDIDWPSTENAILFLKDRCKVVKQETGWIIFQKEGSGNGIEFKDIDILPKNWEKSLNDQNKVSI